MSFRDNKTTQIFLPVEESIKQEVDEFISNYSELKFHLRIDITNFIWGSIFQGSVVELIMKAFPNQEHFIRDYKFSGSFDLSPSPKHLFFEFKGKKQALVFTNFIFQEQGRLQNVILLVSDLTLGKEILDIFCQIDKTDRIKKGIAICRHNGNEYVPCSSLYTWDHIFWNDELKNDVRNNIEFFLNRKDWFLKHNLPWKRGFLFAGPPGNGKTLLSKILASTYNLTCYMFDFFDDYSSANRFRELYASASKTAPSVIIIEDLDKVLTEKEDGIVMANVGLDTILSVLDGITEYPGIITIATANNLELIDPALKHRPKRFDRIFEITNPDLDLRINFLSHLFKNISPGLLDKLSSKTNGFSMAFLSELHVKACMDSALLGREDPIDEDILNAFEAVFPHWNSEKVKIMGFKE